MRLLDRRLWAVLPALLALLLLPGCEPGDDAWLACLFGDRVACEHVLDTAPPPPPPVEGAPAPPTGLTAEITAEGVFLNWDQNPETDVRDYTVYQATYDRHDGLMYDRLETTDRTDYLDSFLHRDGTTYFWAVTATDSDGNEGPRSAPVSLVYCTPGHTCDAPPGPPAAPTGLTVVSQDAAGIGLDWNASPESDLRDYYLYRTTTSGQYGDALFSVSGSTSEAVVDAAFYGLVPFTTYFFALSAVDGDGDGREGPRSSEARVLFCPATVSGCPAAPPATIGLRLVSRDAAGVSLDWEDNGAARFVVYDDVIGRPEARVALTGVSSFVHASPEETSHRYSVAAIDADGRLGPRSGSLDVEWCGAGNPTCARGPRSPRNLTATPQPFAVALDWEDNTETDLAGYKVWMATQETGPYSSTHSGLVTASQRTVFDLPRDVVRWFRVTAVDTAGRESSPSTSVSATACNEVCHPALSHLRRSGPKSFPFVLDVSGRVDRTGSARREGDDILGTGVGFAGTFALDRAAKGLDPALRELVEAGLGGTWTASLDWSVTPGVSATKRGVARATFANPAVGSACLRFEETSKVKKRGKERFVVTNGAFTFVGGSAEAASLLGGATYSVETRPDGSLRYDGKGTPAATAGPLPAECLALRR